MPPSRAESLRAPSPLRGPLPGPHVYTAERRRASFDARLLGSLRPQSPDAPGGVGGTRLLERGGDWGWLRFGIPAVVLDAHSEPRVPWPASCHDGAAMTVELLIQAVVRQTMILIAQLATSGGTRAPLSYLADQVFLHLVRELERQGVSRKVSADMFGLGLRTYQRKIQRLIESSTHHGRSVWVAILDYLATQGRATRLEVLEHMSEDDEALVRGALHDLCETGLVTVSGTGSALIYECTSDEELARLRQTRQSEGLDELLWALIYREGPLTLAQLVSNPGRTGEVEAALARLVEAGRVTRSTEDGRYSAKSLVVPLGSPVGWEASIFDHFKAVVNTITCRLRMGRGSASLGDSVGGSTYTLEIWPNHPFEAETLATLGMLRTKIGELRAKIEFYNATAAIPEDHTRVILYFGQCLVPQGSDESHDHP